MRRFLMRALRKLQASVPHIQLTCPDFFRQLEHGQSKRRLSGIDLRNPLPNAAASEVASCASADIPLLGRAVPMSFLGSSTSQEIPPKGGTPNI
jgi:hypothetical protein